MQNCMEVYFKARDEEEEPLKIKNVLDFGVLSDCVFYVIEQSGHKHFFSIGLIEKIFVNGSDEFKLSENVSNYKWPFDFLIVSALPVEDSEPQDPPNNG